MVEEKKKKKKKLPVLMATLATAQTELSWAGAGLRLTKNFFNKMFLIFTNESRTGFENRKTGYGIISPISWPQIKNLFYKIFPIITCFSSVNNIV